MVDLCIFSAIPLAGYNQLTLGPNSQMTYDKWMYNFGPIDAA